MILQEFKNQLNKKGFVELTIKYRRPNIIKPFIEKYKFKKLKNGMIESYLNDKKEFESGSIIHMYSIYRKPLNFKTGKKNKSKAKRIIRYGGIMNV